MARPKKTTTAADTPEKKPRATRKAKAPLTTRENLSALIGTPARSCARTRASMAMWTACPY